MNKTVKLRGPWIALLSTALIAIGVLIGPASLARADYGGDAHNIFGTVTYDNATYDAALPQLEALVDQAGDNVRDLDGIMRGMYFFIPPSSINGTNPNQLKLARVIERRIITKFADMSQYSGGLTDDIWINPNTSRVLSYQMLPVDQHTAYLEIDGLRLLAVSETSANYLVADEDLGLGRCAWSTSNSCTQTVPGSAQTMRITATAQPSSAKVGETLTPHPLFSVTPWRVMYKWQRDTDTTSTVVQLSTNPSYTVQAADSGAMLSCFVYSSKAGYMMDPAWNVEDGSWLKIPVGSVTPPPVDKVFSKTYAPKVSGTTKVGKTLTASVKSWSPKASIHYQWLRDGVAIVGATSRTYKLDAADLGRTISATVTGTRTGYTAVTKSSNVTKVVTPGSITRGRVKVSGTRRVGRILSATTSRWTSGVTFAYQWYRNGVFLEGATSKSLTLAPSDRGSRFKVVVAATKDGYFPATPKSSARTAKVKTGYLTKVTPTITGSVVVEQTLTAVTGAWKPVETTFRYQWYRNGKKIAGATAATYLLVTKDIGKRIKVKVTGSAFGYYTSSRYSASSVKVAALPAPPTPTPTASASPAPSPKVISSPSPSPLPTPTPTATSTG